MGDYARVGGFTLIFIGTLGLLFNEFVLEWGRLATVIFALLNILGLALLAFSIKRRRSQKPNPSPLPSAHIMGSNLTLALV